jgi:hypothetical protein
LGRWRPVVGRSTTGKPQRFYVGNKRDTTEAEARRRLDYIRDLYDRQCAEHHVNHWAPSLVPWAMRLASGPPILVYATDYAKTHTAEAAEQVNIVHRLQSWGVPIQIADPELEASGYRFLRSRIEDEVNRAIEQALSRLGAGWGSGIVEQVRQQAIPANPLDAETRTLHEALDDRRDHLRATGKRNQNGDLVTRVGKCCDRLSYLKQHHEDMALWQLNLPTVERMAAYWRNRPPTKKGSRTSWDHAHDMLKELFRFLTWLENDPSYKWDKPKGLDGIPRSPVRLPEDENQEAFQTARKKTYTPEQLAIIAQHTDAFGRAIIGICINCAFGASEVGQWNSNRYSIRKTHPHAKILGIQSTDNDSWVVGPRPKTGVYGEHWLWPTVADAVAPFLDGRSVLPITGRRTPWYRTHSSNPQSKFNRWWSALLDRVKKQHADIPRLPFGSLRDVLPDVLRREFSDEVASMCLQHGRLGEDELLKCYANVPFRKLFDATKQLESYFRPLLDVL